VERLRDGSYLVDASLSIRDLAEQHHLQFPESAEYETLAGFVLSQLQRIPRGGEIVTHQDWRLTIVDMDGRRIARVKVERRGREVPRPRTPQGPLGDHSPDPSLLVLLLLGLALGIWPGPNAAIRQRPALGQSRLQRRWARVRVKALAVGGR
jgi:hypothetical protein